MKISPEVAAMIKGKSILVVDDEAGIRMVISSIFGACGAKITQASCGNDAIEIAKTLNIDLIISDVRMAQGDGIALLTAIRSKNNECPPFVFVTGASEYTEAMAISRGAQAVINKPFSTTNVLQIAYAAIIATNCGFKNVS